MILYACESSVLKPILHTSMDKGDIQSELPMDSNEGWMGLIWGVNKSGLGCLHIFDNRITDVVLEKEWCDV